VIGDGAALASSLVGGTGDYLSGTISRRIGTAQFILISQAIGLVPAVGWVLTSGDRAPGLTQTLAAAGAGLGLLIGFVAFVQAMVVGTISIVAPISATGVIVPIAVGVASGERPQAAQVLGIVAAVVGLVVASRSPRAGSRRERKRASGSRCWVRRARACFSPSWRRRAGPAFLGRF